MIWKPEHYLFVEGIDPDDLNPHGDLDRILMNGKIMPTVPESEQPFKVRGEDVAFLMEAIAEREAASDHVPDTETFTRRISAVQLYSIAYRIHELFRVYGNGWLKPGEEWPQNLHSEYYNDVDPYLALTDKSLHLEDVKSDKSHFKRYLPLCAKDMLNLFKDIEALDTVILTIPVNKFTPNINNFSYWEMNYYYNVSGTRKNTPIPGGAIYYRDLIGRWIYDSQTQEERLEIDQDFTATIKNFSLSFSSDVINYLSGKSGEMELWAMFSTRDYDSRRPTTKDLSCYALVKLMTIPEGAISGGTFNFPTGYMTQLIMSLISMAKGDSSYVGDFPPFVDRDPSAYKTGSGSTFIHQITVSALQVFLHARIRERTRWESPNN